MMMALLQQRRSIRRFQGKPVEPAKLDLLVEAALRSPSSRGNKPWHFVVVTDPDLLAGLAKAKEHGSSFLGEAPLAIVVCADTSKSDVWIEDASIATIILQLTAESLGLGSCWVQIRDRMHSRQKTAQGYVAGLLNLPEGVMVEAVVAVGYPNETKSPHPKEELLFRQVHLRTFGVPYW